MIALIEITSVLTREENLLKKTLKGLSKEEKFVQILSLTFEEQIHLIINYLISLFNLEILDDPDVEMDTINNQKIQINLINKISFIYGSKSKLRTLDNLHFSTAKVYNDTFDLKIDYLLTSGNNFL